MNKTTKLILSVTVGVLPFYVFAIAEKFLGKTNISINSLFLVYFPVTAIALIIIALLGKIYLKQRIIDYNTLHKNYLLDIAITFLLMIGFYLIQSTSNLTIQKWFPSNIDNSKTIMVLQEIFRNPFYAFVFLIPFTWITQLFLVFSRIFLLKNLWDLTEKKSVQISISIISALFFCLTEIDKGKPALISMFLIILFYNFTYYYYRRISPLIISAILIQTIQMIDFWISLMV